jgi:hypothetical protein
MSEQVCVVGSDHDLNTTGTKHLVIVQTKLRTAKGKKKREEPRQGDGDHQGEVGTVGTH